MSSSAHIDNKKKKHISSWKRTNTRVITYINCRKNVSINFTVTNKKICLSLHYNGANSYFFVNGTEIYKFTAKDSEIFVGPICLRNISEDWLVDNMKKAGFTGLVMFMILVLIMILVQSTILKIFISIWWRKII